MFKNNIRKKSLLKKEKSSCFRNFTNLYKKCELLFRKLYFSR